MDAPAVAAAFSGRAAAGGTGPPSSSLTLASWRLCNTPLGPGLSLEVRKVGSPRRPSSLDPRRLCSAHRTASACHTWPPS